MNRHLREKHNQKKRIICDYCGKEYPRINDHLLRCKQFLRKKIEYVQFHIIISNNEIEFDFHSPNQINNKNHIKYNVEKEKQI